MPNSNIVMVHKLQQAINGKGEKITYHTSQFYSIDQDRPVTKYTIRKTVFDERLGRYKNIDLFNTYSLIQVVLFLRDYWYRLNNQELPTDNEMWNKVRDKLNTEGGS